jgi:hypothetical protein
VAAARGGGSAQNPVVVVATNKGVEGFSSSRFGGCGSGLVAVAVASGSL